MIVRHSALTEKVGVYSSFPFQEIKPDNMRKKSPPKRVIGCDTRVFEIGLLQYT